MQPIIKKTCPICKKVFKTPRINNKRYCSVECRQKGCRILLEKRKRRPSKIDIRLPVEAVDEAGIDFLRYAIIESAIKDYRRALEKRNRGSIISLERFFLGEWGEKISGGNGQYIIENIRKQVMNNGRK